MNGSTAPFSDDAMISSVQSFSGNNSLYFPNNGLAGPEDILLMFDTYSKYNTSYFIIIINPLCFW